MSTSIILEIKHFHSPDVDLARWEPDDRADVYLFMELNIGEKGKEGSDIFDLMVVTPEALRVREAGDFVLAGRATVVVRDYSWREVKRAIEEIVQRCAAATWEDSVPKLQRYFRWEYEDYVVTGDWTS